MSSQPAPTRLTDRKRAAILDAAVAEFRQSGYEVTSMDKIAASAGVSKRTVYNHFPSKEALFAQILEQMWERSVGGPRPGLPQRPPAARAVAGTDEAEAAPAATTTTSPTWRGWRSPPPSIRPNARRKWSRAWAIAKKA